MDIVFYLGGAIIIAMLGFISGWTIGQSSGYDSGREDGASGRYGN